MGSPSGINLLGYWKYENHIWEKSLGLDLEVLKKGFL